jgi:hypothetical protein
MNIEWQSIEIEGQRGSIGRFGEVNMLTLQHGGQWVGLASAELKPGTTQSEQMVCATQREAEIAAVEMGGYLLLTLQRHRIVEAESAFRAGK